MTSPRVGERVAAYRRQRGISQRELASEMRRSESWVSQVERGVQPVERLSVLHALADALGVTVHDLRPEALRDTGSSDAKPAVNDLDALRLCLTGHLALDLLFTAAETPPRPADLDALRNQVEDAWKLAHSSQFAKLSAALTDLLPQLERATRTPGSPAHLETLHALRARSYQAAAAAFARQDEPDAAWVAADRAITAAEQAGNPLEVVAGHFRLAHAFLRLRRYDQAEQVATQATDALQPHVAAPDTPPEMLSLYGAIHLTQAITAAQEGNRTKAHSHLTQASEIAARVGEGRNDFATEFGPTNVQIHAVAVAVDLGDAGEALDVAQQVDTSQLSAERQARLLVDTARAHAQRRHIDQATTALRKAEQLAPEHVHSHHHSRSTITDLLTLSGQRPTADLLELAQRTGTSPHG